ncbi:MAG: AraC family transcriptional regulator [Cyanobacteria bacterium P01_D01_bin.115]
MALSIEPSYLSNILKSEMNAERIELIPTFATQRDALILAIGQALKAELATGGALGQLYVDSLTTTLCVHLLRHYATRSPQLPTHKGGLSSDRLRRTLDLIHASLDQSLRLETLAAAVGLDVYYFSRLFRQSMGISPYQYVLQQRIEKAKSLLQNQALTVTAIALECGFTDSSHLARQFRKTVGMSPRDYRQQIR